ncbi:MAG: ribosome-associated translation inhibitor RaiA [Spirochaetia bacterium]|nr:ribosome-associated translation inhibitor RaiA [Spirochaetia bacterium]
MDITYHGLNIETTDAMKEYAQKKIEKLAGHINNIISVTVRFRVEKINHIVEFTINGDGAQFIAEDQGPDMYAAIDLLERKLEKQIKKHKEKHMGKHHRK